MKENGRLVRSLFLPGRKRVLPRQDTAPPAGRCGHRPLRSSIGKRFVGVGLPDDPHRTCTKLLALRRAGCPQPAVRQLPHPPGRARGPCPTKILRITPGGLDRPPLRRNALQGGTHVSRRTPHPLQKNPVTGVAIRVPRSPASCRGPGNPRAGPLHASTLVSLQEINIRCRRGKTHPSVHC